MDKDIKITRSETLSGGKYNLRKIVFDHTNNKGLRTSQTRIVFDRGNGAAVLLYNKQAGTVILTRQFRLPSYLSGNATGMLIEVAAGELDDDAPEAAIRREAEEETGFRVAEVTKVFEAYMSPGATTEILYFFIAEYSAAMKIGEGGGLEAEQEDIEVVEMRFEDALAMVGTGEIKDAKTMMLLLYVRAEGLL
ncbi:MAG TPA: NUDIX domain-containing protein [Puia sp.]|jgi:nudix-type nucleoside diphosphatase (YffH/AdpP family)|nr:NUDIX domain-containing protein [Puia sp.]